MQLPLSKTCLTIYDKFPIESRQEEKPLAFYVFITHNISKWYIYLALKDMVNQGLITKAIRP